MMLKYNTTICHDCYELTGLVQIENRKSREQVKCLLHTSGMFILGTYKPGRSLRGEFAYAVIGMFILRTFFFSSMSGNNSFIPTTILVNLGQKLVLLVVIILLVVVVDCQ